MSCVITSIPFFFGPTFLHNFQRQTTTQDFEFALVFKISSETVFNGRKLLKPYKNGVPNTISKCKCLCSEKDQFTSSVKIVISGYWFGPDSDDGWGFVEAVIHRI